MVGGSTANSGHSDEDSIHSIIKRMYANGQAWATASPAEREAKSRESLMLGAQLAQYGINAIRGDDGVWYIDRVGGEKLFEKYRQYIYHQGGIAGNHPTLKQNEMMAVLENGEAVLDKKRESSVMRLIDFVTMITEKVEKIANSSLLTSSILGARSGIADSTNRTLGAVTSNQSVAFGDVYIYGGSEETVEKHREINRQFTNDVLKQLNIKK